MILKDKSKLNEQDHLNLSQTLFNKNKNIVRFNLIGRLGTKIEYLEAKTKMKLSYLNKTKLTLPISNKNIMPDSENEFYDLKNPSLSDTSTNTELKLSYSNQKTISNKTNNIITDKKLLYE